MTKSPDDAAKQDEQPDGDAFAEDKPSESSASENVGSDEAPGPGGYAGRDPKTEMPRMPTDPEPQDEE